MNPLDIINYIVAKRPHPTNGIFNTQAADGVIAAMVLWKDRVERSITINMTDRYVFLIRGIGIEDIDCPEILGEPYPVSRKQHLSNY